MNQRWTVLLGVAIVVASASPAFAAAPLTLERHEQAVERVAPLYPTIPGRTLCVCQTANDASTTHVGYLNSYQNNAAGDITVNMACVYPVFSPGLGSNYCLLFEVIK